MSYFGDLDRKEDNLNFIHGFNEESSKRDLKSQKSKDPKEESSQKPKEIPSSKKENEKPSKSEKPSTNITKTAEYKNLRHEIKQEIKSELKKDKPQSILELEDKFLRRFSVKIRDIRFQNLQKDILNVFLQFIIGKDIKKEVYVTALGRQTKFIQTSDGLRFKSELMKAVEHGEMRNIKMNYDSEYRASYEMLAEQNLTIQVWGYNRWSLNTYLGKYSISLTDLANDNITKAIGIKMSGQNKKILGRVYFTGYFQEIWDWKINFIDWKGMNIVNSRMQPTDSRISLTLKTKEIREPFVESKQVKSTSNPYWQELQGSMQYRGTLDEFENNYMSIELKTNDKTVHKIVSMRGITSSAYIKASFKLYDTRSRLKNDIKSGMEASSINPSKLAPGTPSKITSNINDPFAQFKKLSKNTEELDNLAINIDISNSQDSQEDSKDDENEEEILQQQNKHLIFATIEGRVLLNNIPRFKQKGELIRFKKNERYLVITINRVDSIMAPDDRNRIDSFISVNWGGHEKKTQVFIDSNQPEFNEIIIYRIPGKLSSHKIEKIEQLKEELNTRSEILFNLWIQNQDESNESVGYAKFRLSEIEKAPKEEQIFHEFYSRKKIVHSCRVSEFTSSFKSAIIDSPNTKIMAQIHFFPDIPEKLDLRTLKYDEGDKYPKSISEDMLSGTSGGFFLQWEEEIKMNFSNIVLEKTVLGVFKNYLFVKDQYSKTHFLSKYIGKYSIEESYPNDMAIFSKPDKTNEIKHDLRMKTYGELAHLVKCIPFFDESRRNNDIWLSSDFVLTLKKGGIQDHAILLANLFMGTIYESNEDLNENQKKNHYVPNEDRVFVCIGTIGKRKPEFHCWVMTIDKELEVITFWETLTNQKFELKGRINDNKEAFRNFLIGKTEITNKGNLFENFGKKFKDIGKNISPSKLLSKDKKSSKKSSTQKNLTIPLNKKNIEEEEDEEESINYKDEYNDSRLEKEDLVEIFEDPIVDINTMPSFFQTNSKRKNPQKFGEPQITQPSENDQGKESKFLQVRKDEIRTKEKNSQNEIRLQPKTYFVDKKTQLKVDLQPLPYRSLEIIFNHKNAYANMQHQNPGHIEYNLFNETEWRPYIKDKINKKGWSEDLGVFYETKSLGNPLNLEDCGRKMQNIIQEVMVAITKVRNGSKFQTKWKNRIDKTNRHLEAYLRILENRDTRRLNDEELKREIDKWTIDMKALLPVNFKLFGMPMFFNYIEPEKIRSLIIENAEQFYMKNFKESYFGIAGKIFPYPNNFNSVRLIIAIYCKINDEIEEPDSEDEIDQIQGEITKKNDDNIEYQQVPNDEKKEMMKANKLNEDDELDDN